MKCVGRCIVLVLAVFLLLNGTPAYAYIDPGTGSMLFSVVLGASTTVFFVLYSLFIKLKSYLFFGQKISKTTKPFVLYSEGKQYYCVFKPIADEFERRGIPLTYYTSAEDDPIFEQGYKHVHCEFIGKGNKAYFKLAFLNADICLMTTPQLDVLQLRKSKNVKHYCHILHAIGYCCDYHLYGLDYYESVLLDAEYQIPLIREIECKRNLPGKELVVVGSSYLDYYENLRQNSNFAQPDGKTILVAPTWGRYGLLSKFGKVLLDKLAEADYNIIVRPHPQSMLVEKELINELMERYKNKPNVVWNFDSDNLKVLASADIMISDFSCVMFDFALLFNRPFLYVDTELNVETLDMCDLDEIPWRYNVVKKIGKEIKVADIEDLNIKDMIEEVISNEDTKRELALAKDYAWTYRNESAKRIVDYLVSKQRELIEKC